MSEMSLHENFHYSLVSTVIIKSKAFYDMIIELLIIYYLLTIILIWH